MEGERERWTIAVDFQSRGNRAVCRVNSRSGQSSGQKGFGFENEAMFVLDSPGKRVIEVYLLGSLDHFDFFSLRYLTNGSHPKIVKLVAV